MKVFLFSFLLLNLTISYGQVGIGTENPNATVEIVAMADDLSVTDGLILPKLTGDQLRLKSSLYNEAQTGTIVYVTNADSSPQNKTIKVLSQGLYYFNGKIWENLKGDSSKTGKIYDFVEFKESNTSLTLTSSFQELASLSTTYEADSDGILFLNYNIYSIMANSSPRVSNTYGEIRVTDLTDNSTQTGTILISPVVVVTNQGSNAVSTSTTKPITIVSGHNYSIKLFVREAYLSTSSYTIQVGTVKYSTNSANSSLTITSLTNP
ncbi:hypothetical protein [Chishuiella sp.]|uniref:hypothetical protein n=1 Tax=Chishuiella sp. TaxID=1969467 RepID=UPI0028AEF945|nr:hypothetical protein [Chishuiella sp.]